MSSSGPATNESSRSSRRKRGASKTNFDQIDIDEMFQFAGGKNGDSVGDGYYVSTTINRKRYYGVLISQEALRQASDIFFQDEALSLEINKRMAFLQQKQISPEHEDDTKGKNNFCIKLDNKKIDETHQVQKFKYCDETTSTSGYRVILATYANILEASNGDDELFEKIKVACDEGGNWVGKYYYQYEVKRNSLKALESTSKKEPDGLFTSMSFNSFLLSTQLPMWYPLRNVYTSRAKILNMLNLKTNKCGLSVRHNTSETFLARTPAVSTSRKHFRVAIIGAGLSGLGCAQELLRLSSEKNIPLEVVLIEARDRVGGRCHTDRRTFKTPKGNEFPVDLGACWIHGATGNPLAQLAQSVGLKMSKADENVKLLVGKMREADESADAKISKLFDEVLDCGAQKCFTKDEMDLSEREQMAIRFYAQVLEKGTVDFNHETRTRYQYDVAKHRYSSDSSVCVSIRKDVAEKCSDMTEEESNILSWNMKHTEYSFGANIDDLSMKYWDFDSQYAFEGPHLQLRDGYSTIAEAILLQCSGKNNFKLSLNNPVKKIEYGLSLFPRSDIIGNQQKTISISDACRITIKDNCHDEYLFSDFAVCTLPLGVLKSSQVKQNEDSAVIFEPPLPDYKTDCIEHVGFGVLNKIYLQFPTSFWRKRDKKENLKGTPFLSDTEVNFGNASGIHPEYYMFFDVGFDLSNPGDPDNPNILHTLISGLDAVNAENLADDVIVHKVMKILKHLFSDVEIPEPKAYLITRWCSDNCSQGAYSFLAPGSSDQDYLSLQSPVCADGDFLHVGYSKTMRLFFAGEHTSSHYPSLAHGAYISGLRAAREIISNISLQGSTIFDQDRLVPVIRYRQRNPEAPLLCTLCDLPTTDKEGDLLSFQRDKRIVLVHRKCVLYSPDVSFNDGVWRNVIKCVNRGRQLRCVRCRKNGATIGCSEPTCKENYHFGCCDKDWSFEENGKGYFCSSHRKRSIGKEDENATIKSSALGDNQGCNTQVTAVNQAIDQDMGKDTTSNHHSETIGRRSGCIPISIDQFKERNPLDPIVCALCKSMEKSTVCGALLAFNQGENQVLVHDECLKSSNIIRASEDQKVLKVFEIVNAARTCFRCYRDGATIRCNHSGCFRHYHFDCAIKTGPRATFSTGFFCSEHLDANQVEYVPSRKKQILLEPKQIEMGNGMYSHDLFYEGSYRHDSSHLYKLKKRKRHYAPSNDFKMTKMREPDNLLEKIASNESKEPLARRSSSMVMRSPIQYDSSRKNIAFTVIQGRISKSSHHRNRVERLGRQINSGEVNNVPTESVSRSQNGSKELRDISTNQNDVLQQKKTDVKEDATNKERLMIITVESDDSFMMKNSAGDANNPITLDDDSSLSD